MKGLQGMMKNLIDEVADSREHANNLERQLSKGEITFSIFSVTAKLNLRLLDSD